MIKGFKPNLIPNNKTDYSDIDWFKRIPDPINWDVSEKLDGIRAELFFNESGRCVIKTRSLKPFKSVWIKKLENKLDGLIYLNCVMEGEIFCKGMQFNELQHFILSEDVTSEKAKKKLARERCSKDGKFVNREFGWLSTYAHDFKINLFDTATRAGTLWAQRKNELFLFYHKIRHINEVCLITQMKFDSVDGILNFYKTIEDKGGEGLIVRNQHHAYKFNRTTLLQNTVFKMKDEFNIYYGIVTDILEGTVVDENAPKTINELGGSVTSKRNFDRFPSGRAKAFEVVLDNSRHVKVTLKGYNNFEKTILLNNRLIYIGKKIKFLALKPTKINGVPRHAKVIKGNL